MVAFLTFILASVLNAATSASLRNNTNPIPTAKPQSSCSTICEAFGAPDGCSLEMKTRGMSEELSKVMLDKHNQLRRKLAKGEQENQPSAANMKKLVWNEKLSLSAQEKAEQCNTSSGTLDVPQAAFGRTWRLSDPGNGTTMTMDDFEKIVQLWYTSTIDSFDFLPFPKFGQIEISAQSFTGNAPFSANTKALGCGLMIYSREDWRMLELSCIYDSPNVDPASDQLYEAGPPCYSCQPGFSCDDGLCALSNPQVSTTEQGSTESSSTEGQSTDVSRHTGTGSTSDWENYAM